jgi:predicted metal-dependent peptidase
MASSSSLPIELRAARFQIVSTFPYFAEAVLNVTLIATDQVPTMATDKKWRTYYNPSVLTKWTAANINGVLLHEVMHLFLDHPRRGGLGSIDAATHDGKTAAYSQHDLWNIAADLEINQKEFFKGNFELPSEGCFPETMRPPLPVGLMAEEYYDLLQQHPPPHQPLSAAGGSCGSCAVGGEGDSEGAEADANADPNTPGIGPMESSLIQRIVANAIIEHESRGRGTVPGGLARWASKLLNPQVPWPQVLRSALRASIAGSGLPRDWTYRKPARRQIAGVILPAMERYSPKVGMAIDTSGSMGPTESATFYQALGEIQGVIAATGLRSIPVIAGDAEVGSEQMVSNPLSVQLTGGGGTDMGVLLQKLADLRVDVAILYTDGETPWPSAALSPKTLILCTTDIACPTWATTIRIHQKGHH